MSYQQPAPPPGAYNPYPPPQPPAKKGNKVLWIVLGLLIGVPTVLGVGCVACLAIIGSTAQRQAGQQAARSGSSATATSPGAAPAGRPEVDGMPVYKTGESVNIGYMGYQVFGSWYASRLSSNQFLDQPPDASYLFVDLGVANVDKEERTVPPFKLLDENGAEYGVSDKAWASEGSIGVLTNLNPGVSKRAYVIFDVPKGRRYKLKVSGGYWSADDALVELSPAEKKGR